MNEQLQQALTAFEDARVAKANADADDASKTEAFTAAQAAKSDADNTQKAANTTYNTNIDALIAALNAAKVPVGPELIAAKK